ncbi:MAG: T9SS type A sorting domain-containing protein [Saprospiraceae bacterium]|nr:T9SS type A sorting domain-containing protein [Saprospiraceae bacterium]
MKKTSTQFLAFILSVLAIQLIAQTGYKLTPTTYVGALSSDPATDWTANWTNFDPKTTAYPAVTDDVTLNGMLSSLPIPGEKEITTAVTLDASKVYALKGIIVVRSGGSLTIPAGTIIRALADQSTTPKNYATLVIERGGKLNVLGTATSPVVFTSGKDANSRERGDWGGILIAGKGLHNLLDGTTNNNVQMEGFNNISFDPTMARFGGTDPLDNSGELKYVRIEFGGLAFEANKEINGLTLGAVGSGTQLGYIQVSYCGDDSFEWFGGSVNSHHLIAYKGTDDDFDTDNGYSGLSQFGIAIKDTNYYDLTYNAPSGASTSEGFESDNEATGTAGIRPLTTGVFSNYTMVGPVAVGTKYSALSSTSRAAFRRGARIRRNSGLKIVNSIFMGYRNFVMIDGDSCVRRTNYPAALALVSPNTPVEITNQISFANNLIVNTNSAYTSTTDTTANGLVEVARAANSGNKLAALDAWLRQTGPLANSINPVEYLTGTVLVNPLASSTAPDFKPVSGSPALSNANFTDNPVLRNLISSNKEIKAALSQLIYPNPVRTGTIHFGKEVLSYGIFNVNGALLQHGFNAENADVNSLTPGLYLIKVEGIVQKFIIE